MMIAGQPSLDAALDTLRRDTILALAMQAKDILVIVQERRRQNGDTQSVQMIGDALRRLDAIFDAASTL